MAQNTPIGYQALIDIYSIEVMPHYRRSYVTSQHRTESKQVGGQVVYYYAQSYMLANPRDPMSNIEFAIKHEGINLEIVKAVFQQMNTLTLIEYIQKAPSGKYIRKIWFLYEWLIQKYLPIDDLKGYKYVELFDPSLYFTIQGERSSRHGIINNSLGNNEFCPLVRKTEKLSNYIDKKLDDRVKNLIAHYDAKVIERASHYLFTKETKSSFEIEREHPDRKRLARFVDLLQHAGNIESINKKQLLDIQKLIVDPRFADIDYRETQNYVGETLNPYVERIHYISPKKDDVPQLMDGLLQAYEQMIQSNIHPVIIAACIAFGFVFIHPFEDGNGRLHRFLIHYALVKTGFTPKGIIFPVSAVMLQHLQNYDQILETFSKPLMSLINHYHLDNEGILEVHQETKLFYQFHDFTDIVAYLFECIDETINEYFKQELDFIINYDKTKKGLQNIVDMPDKLIDLFIKCLLQNDGELSAAKRNRYFDKLSDDEVIELSAIVQQYMINKK